MKTPESKLTTIYGAVFGSPPNRCLRLLIPKDHPLNDRILREWGADSEEAIDSDRFSSPILAESYRQYKIPYDERARVMLCEDGLPLDLSVIEERTEAEEILATPMNQLKVHWNDTQGNEGEGCFPLTPAQWQSNAQECLGDLQRGLRHLHLDPEATCNEDHALEVMSAVARLGDLLGPHFPDLPTSAGTPDPPGKKWVSYLDRIAAGLSARHLTPEEESHGK